VYECSIDVNVAELRQQLRVERVLSSSGHVTEHSSQQVLPAACNEGISVTQQFLAHDALHKHGVTAYAAMWCPSVHLSRLCILSK